MVTAGEKIECSLLIPMTRYDTDLSTKPICHVTGSLDISYWTSQLIFLYKYLFNVFPKVLLWCWVPLMRNYTLFPLKSMDYLQMMSSGIWSFALLCLKGQGKLQPVILILQDINFYPIYFSGSQEIAICLIHRTVL